MASKLFISAKEVAKELEVSDSYAYRLIRQLNMHICFQVSRHRWQNSWILKGWKN